MHLQKWILYIKRNTMNRLKLRKICICNKIDESWEHCVCELRDKKTILWPQFHMGSENNKEL